METKRTVVAPMGGAGRRRELKNRVASLARGAMNKVLLFDKLGEIYAEALRRAPGQMPETLIEALEIQPVIAPENQERIPATGVVVVVTNQPFGAVEALVLAAVLRSVRADVKIVANHLLGQMADLEELLISLRPVARGKAGLTNFRAVRRAVEWLRGGGMLGTFPTGEVLQLGGGKRVLLNPPWNEAVARLIRTTRAAVLPVHFRGASGAVFQLLGRLHPRLRTALVPHELLQQRERRIEVCVGNVIPFKKLADFSDDQEMTGYLRQRTSLLEVRATAGQADKELARIPGNRKSATAQYSEATVGAEPADVLGGEIEQLPRTDLLAVSGEYEVYCARASEIAHVLREIGRLREIAFRETGEGTGKALDLDDFDSYYLHLFLWNREAREIVGAYRLGKTDSILRRFGPKGLYTSTLFRFKPELIERISPALEMGRSFIRVEYQRTYAALPLLWRGIGQYVLQNPQYKNLFGPVSISNEYKTVSRQLMVEFLKRHHFLTDMSELVEARTPFRTRRVKGCDPRALCACAVSVEELTAMIEDVEADNKGVPILLKHYLKLGGNVMGFNVDPSFSDCVDGLILVDLTRTDRRILDRYMGKEGAGAFLEFHASVVQEAS